MFISVDLPEPLDLITATNSPFDVSSEMPPKRADRHFRRRVSPCAGLRGQMRGNSVRCSMAQVRSASCHRCRRCFCTDLRSAFCARQSAAYAPSAATQLVVRAAFDDGAVIQNDNLVCVRDGGQSMCDHDGRAGSSHVDEGSAGFRVRCAGGPARGGFIEAYYSGAFSAARAMATRLLAADSFRPRSPTLVLEPFFQQGLADELVRRATLPAASISPAWRRS